MDETKNKGGRPKKPTNLDNELAHIVIENMLRLNRSDREIAAALKVKWANFCRWKQKHPEFWANSEIKPEVVEASFVMRAVGFTRLEPIYDDEGQVTGTKEVYYPPDTRAAMFYLINKKPAEYRANIEHENAIAHQPVSLAYSRGDESKKKAVIEAVSEVVQTLVDDSTKPD